MNHISFGSTLKEARIAKGYDINTVARRLRIRPDILQAIEESDFERIPPRGYARNMINSYAHLLGLDANEVTRMYLDEAYANSVGVAHGSMSEMRAQQRATAQSSAHPGRTSGFSRVDSGSARLSSRDGGQVNGLGRRTYALEMEDKISGGANRTAAARMGMGSSGNEGRTPHPSNRSALQDGRYLNAVEGRSRSPQIEFQRYLPFALGGLIVVIVLFIVLNLTVCHQQEPTETIPVTNEQGDSSSTDASTGDAASSDDSSSTDASSSTTTTTEKAPTKFTLSYKIADGTSTYLEIKVDGKYVVASDVTGPKSGEYTSSDTIQFVSSNSKGLTVSIDGEEQKIKENSSGIYNATFKFSDILKQWNKDHPDAASSSTSKSSSSSSKSSTTTSSSSDSSKGTTASTTSDDNSTSSDTSSDSSSADTLSVTGSSTTSVGSSGSSSGTSSTSGSTD